MCKIQSKRYVCHVMQWLIQLCGFHINVMCRGGWRANSQCHLGSQALLMRPAAVGKKLFLCCEVLVLMDRSLLPEGSDSNSLCLGWEGSGTIFLARFRVLEVYSSWRDGRLQPVTFSAEWMIHCSLPLSLAVAAAYQMVSPHLTSWVLMVPRKRKDSTMPIGDVGVGGVAFFL